MKFKHNIQDGFCSFSIDERIYPLSVIMKTAYVFIDEFYLYLNYLEPNIIQVELKPKKEMSSSKLEDTIGEFNNELLNQTIRLEVFSKTKGIRELIFARALHSASIQLDEPQVLQNIEKTESSSLTHEEDDLSRIAQNWFDAFPAEDKNDNNA
ncbi:His-Xaa-Ser system protein HxsD [Desulfosporosinus shakirovi]|uniref:His-Xaa-Ser system protein HxsD n=1 Tax=Desulfosporosinus shakirovi TaxID=2885154 RepID=UPI001E4AA9FD|nr:His-Xaa-Ser system protein HxsD [Desulfosporosinus sp. SRJS8]MCB8818321.1 His-Xaa-Ser system protein HxsD [Desulfosporosinus sp. SRJS8]